MQGKGIRLVQTEDELQRALACVELSDAVASHYIDKPLLLDGLKFDLRIYALVTSCEPLRVFLFKQGLVRCCTQAYQRPEVSPGVGGCISLGEVRHVPACSIFDLIAAG